MESIYIRVTGVSKQVVDKFMSLFGNGVNVVIKRKGPDFPTILSFPIQKIIAECGQEQGTFDLVVTSGCNEVE